MKNKTRYIAEVCDRDTKVVLQSWSFRTYDAAEEAICDTMAYGDLGALLSLVSFNIRVEND